MAGRGSGTGGKGWGQLARRYGGRSGRWRTDEAQVYLAKTTYDAPPPDCEEAELQAKAEALLTAEGWTWYHANVSLLDKRGYPDLVALRAGVMFYAELKKATGRTSPQQRRWMAELIMAGQVVYLLRPANWATLVAIARIGDLALGEACRVRLADTEDERSRAAGNPSAPPAPTRKKAPTNAKPAGRATQRAS